MDTRKLSRTAIVSLVMTVIFGVTPWIYAILRPDASRVTVPILLCIISLIIGLISLISEMINGKDYRLSFCSLVFNIIVIALLWGVFSNSEGSPTEKARRISCAGNLKLIQCALKQYTIDYSGNFPPANGAAGLEYLRKYDYLTDCALAVCSSTKTTPAKSSQALTEDTVDYVYVGGLTEKSDSNTPILYDKSGNHQDFGNVGTVDGAAKGIAGKDWKKEIGK